MPAYQGIPKPSPLPSVPREISSAVKKANLAFPQMYGMMIIRAGRIALDMILDGKMTVDHFADTKPGYTQKRQMIGAAIVAHKRARVEVPFAWQDCGLDTMHGGIVTPFSALGVYMRTQRGILDTIQNHAWNAVDIAEEEIPERRDTRRRYAGRKLLEDPANRKAALLLQTIWHTADNALTGPPVTQAAVSLHRALSNLPDARGPRRAAIASATRAARTVLNPILVSAIEPLKPCALEALGDRLAAEDAIESFPLCALYEGDSEYTDEDIALLSSGKE